MIDVSIRLRRAILHDDLLLVTRILKNHSQYLHNPDPTSFATSLHLASELGHVRIVRFLVEQAGHEVAGVSRDGNGDTPLMVASAEGRVEVVEYLVGCFGRVEGRNKAGMTALMMAARKGMDAVVNMLLDLGADVDVVDGMGNTSLHYASSYGHLKVIRSLIERGASCGKLNRQGFIAEEYSYTHQAEQYFKQLVQDREKLWMQENVKSRAATPIFGKSERTIMPQRQRASSGS